MKLLILSSLYRTTPTNGAGSIENFVHALANALISEYNCDVTVVCKHGSTGGLYKTVTTDFDNFKAVVIAEIANIKPDLINLHFDDLFLLKKLLGVQIPTLFTVHSYSELSQWLEVVKKAGKNIYFSLVSDSLREVLFDALDKNDIKYDPKKFVTTWIGTDVAYISSHSRKRAPKYFLYLGLVRKHKAVLELVRAFSKTTEALKIVGPLKNIPYCDEVIAEVIKTPNVSYYGEAQTIDEKIKLFDESKALILATGFSQLEPDCNEAFGLVMVEANAAGVPIIGYAQGNISKYVDSGVNGFLFKNEDELLKLINFTNLENMRDSCFSKAQQYDLKRIVANYYNLYERLQHES